jgi:hypothetical protein
MLRGIAFVIGLLAALPAIAGEMTADEARHFVIGKVFNYTCFEGTRGQGRIFPDGSVVGSIQIRGKGHVHYAALPPGTLRLKGQSVCASVRGLPIQPCFNLNRTSETSFRGSISGLGFAYCEFSNPHTTTVASSAPSPQPLGPQPLGLRPSLAADKR